MILGNSMNIVIFILSVQSIVLIYSLMSQSVNQRKFEYGILRMLGVPKVGVVQLIGTQSLYFIIPSIVLGFMLSTLALVYIAGKFKAELNLNMSIWPSGSSTFAAASIAILIPLISSFLPIKDVLAQSLAVITSTARVGMSAIKITFEKGTDDG